MTEEHRTLIETFLPVDEISKEAKLEKLGNAKPPISSLHYWWTRKPLITARAAVLGALLPSDFNQQEFKKLLGLDRNERAHNYDVPSDRIEQLKEEYNKVWGEIPTVLDPFAGGGSIPFEAMRVGTNVIANDYNPLAYLIEKATLEYPSKYGEQLSKDVEKGLKWIFDETRKELEKYYPSHKNGNVTAYVWAWSIKCPKCGFNTPLVGQWGLSRKKNRNITLKYQVVNNDLKLSIEEEADIQDSTCSDGKGRCVACGASISNDVVKNDIFTRENERLLALILTKNKGKEYVIPSEEDIEAFNKAKDALSQKQKEFFSRDLIPLEEMPDDNRGTIWAKEYLKYWQKLLNPRQLLLFVTLEINIQKYYEEHLNEANPEYKLAIVTYLSFILGKHIDRNCRAIVWDRTNGQISSATGKRSIGMLWDHAEVNPFIKGSGSLIGVMKSINGSITYSIKKIKRGSKVKISNLSITALNERVPIIVTDPPYFDDIQYAELSEFFYVWERKALKNIIDLGEVSKNEDMSVGGNRDKKTFNRMFNLSCKKFFEILPPNGILVMFFAHSSVEAWDFVVNALKNSGFRITATWPIHTENTENQIARGNASIMSSIIIVARKRKTNKSGYIEEIREEVHYHLLKRLDEFWKNGLRGADLTVSAMGVTLDIITQYSDIKSYTGEMQIKDVLELVQKNVAQYVLDRYMKNASGLDAATSFYLYTRLSQLEGMPFDTANLIAKSMNVDLKLLEKHGLIKTSKKGKAQGIILLNSMNREVNTKQSLIDCVQFVMTTFAKGGYTEVERELATIPFSRTEIKDVLEALLSLPTEDPERQVAQKVLERMGQSFPKQGQTGLDNF